MKRIMLIMLCLIGYGVGLAIASSVTTTDGKNFNVTNDAGYTAVMTNAQIWQKINIFNSAMTKDSQQFLTDEESFVIWNLVGEMSISAANAITNSQTNGT